MYFDKMKIMKVEMPNNSADQKDWLLKVFICMSFNKFASDL